METQKLILEFESLHKLAEGNGNSKNMRQIRDLTLVGLVGGISMVIACDSNASNGEKLADYKKNIYEETAVSVLKVPVMEVLATGAIPIVIVNNLCLEMQPSGKRIIDIMKGELEANDLWDNIQFTGTTEDNMPTTQTGIGVTVIGLLTEENSKIGKTKKGDEVICIGRPQSGIVDSYSEKDPDVAKIKTVKTLSKLEYVHEILPIGSKGAAYEAGELARVVELDFYKDSLCSIDLKISAGSSTAVLVSIKAKDFEQLQKAIDVPIFLIGEVR